MSIVRLFVLVAGRAVASHAVGLGLIGKGLVHRSNHRLGRVDLHVADVMAAAAGDVIHRDHPLLNGFGHFFTLFDLLFGRAECAADFTPQRVGTGNGLVPEQAHNLSLADGVHGFILQVAVHAFGFGAREGLGVLSLLVGSVGRVHRVAESAAECENLSDRI